MSIIATLNSSYRNRLKDLQASNKRYTDAVSRQIDIEFDLSDARRLNRKLKVIHEKLTSRNAEFIEQVVESLRSAVEYSINSVLPLKFYTVSIDYVPYRDNGTLKLYLHTEDGHKVPPKIIEGDMLNQVLSVASIIHISIQMGYKTIFYDEAFPSANIRSIALINSLIDYHISRGVKFVMVTQNPALYAGLERTMIELISDGKQVTDIKSINVKPNEDELDAVAQVTDLFDTLTQYKE